MKTKSQKNTRLNWLFLLALMTVLCFRSYSQIHFKQTGTATFTIAGTSTMHDWTMTSQGATYNANMDVNADGNVTEINMVSVVIPAESLKSKEKAMDRNAYNSLKTDKYKDITFQLTSAKVNQKTIICTGNLTISGVTKSIQIDVNYENSNGNLFFKGSKKIKMSDYKVDPPTFMFGAIKTGDEITISFDVTLSPIKL